MKPELLERAKNFEDYLRCLWTYEEIPESEVEQRRRAAGDIYASTGTMLDLRDADSRLIRKIETKYLGMIEDWGLSWVLPILIQDRIDRFEPVVPWDELIQDNDKETESAEERREDIRIILPELFSILGITVQPHENEKGYIEVLAQKLEGYLYSLQRPRTFKFGLDALATLILDREVIVIDPKTRLFPMMDRMLDDALGKDRHGDDDRKRAHRMSKRVRRWLRDAKIKYPETSKEWHELALAIRRTVPQLNWDHTTG